MLVSFMDSTDPSSGFQIGLRLMKAAWKILDIKYSKEHVDIVYKLGYSGG